MPPQGKPGVVYDCMIYLQGAGSSRGPAYALLQRARLGSVLLYTSQAVLDEALDVLTRPETRRRFPDLTEARVHRFLDEVAEHAVCLAGVPQQFSYPRDPKDEKYVNLALAAGAAYLVSRDKDLLDLMDDDGFRERFPHLTILDPVAFLRLADDIAAEPRDC